VVYLLRGTLLLDIDLSMKHSAIEVQIEMYSFSKAITCGEEVQEELLLHMAFEIVTNEAMGYGGFNWNPFRKSGNLNTGLLFSSDNKYVEKKKQGRWIDS